MNALELELAAARQINAELVKALEGMLATDDYYTQMPDGVPPCAEVEAALKAIAKATNAK